MASTPVDGPSGASSWRPPIGSDNHARPLDDAAIVGAILDGDRDAFRVLVDRESGSVVRACVRILGDLHEAEDVAQDAFVTAYRSLATWRGDGPFGAWLTRIAVRLAIRQLGRRHEVTWIGTPDHDAIGDRVASLPASPGSQPEFMVLRAEDASATRRAVANLREPYREVVALRFFGDLSLGEIADETGRPLGTVKTHLHRGLLRLRASLEGSQA
jgi:RNA polymerase sigma-70 factor, ECF subfamily